MITITLEGLGKTHSVLAHLDDPKKAQLAANAMAESYTTDVLDWIASGESFTSRTGGLEGSISWHPEGGGAVVYANKEYALWVEEGTKPHVIVPTGDRKALKIPGPGGYVLRRAVNHPGSKAYPFFFTDLDGRKDHMLGAAQSVIFRELANG